MSRRVAAETLKGLGPKLPKNVILYDGTSRLCATFVNWIFERNFGYLNVELLDDNAFVFSPTQTAEGKRFLAYFDDLRKADVPLILVEKVQRKERYSKSKALQDLQKASSHPLFGATTAPNKSALGQDPKFDVIISVKSRAVLRILWKCDRLWWGIFAYLCYYLVPRFLTDLPFDRVMRRRFDTWGEKTGGLLEPDDVCPHPNKDFLTRLWKLR